MTDVPLPIPYGEMQTGSWAVVDGYTVDQMRAHGDARAAAERKACADYVLTQAMACPADSATRATLESVSAVLRLYGPNDKLTGPQGRL